MNVSDNLIFNFSKKKNYLLSNNFSNSEGKKKKIK